jgi:hypothetical protein
MMAKPVVASARHREGGGELTMKGSKRRCSVPTGWLLRGGRVEEERNLGCGESRGVEGAFIGALGGRQGEGQRRC